MAEERYLRQQLVDGIGEEGQHKLREARVVIVGSGALGCAIADQISRAGLGYIRLIDPDIPEISNLQRQVLIDEHDVANRTPKAEAAAAKMRRANSEVRVETHVTRLVGENAEELLGEVDLVLDGTDNFAARYQMNRTCRELGLPYMFGGVLTASGMAFPVMPDGPCLECALGPEPPEGAVPSTEELGVLCSIVSTIASIEVVRAFKLICGHQVDTRLVVVDLWNETMRLLEVQRNPSCPVCGG